MLLSRDTLPTTVESVAALDDLLSAPDPGADR